MINLKWIKEFVFKQKCMPWNFFCTLRTTKFYAVFSEKRNSIFNINTRNHWDKGWLKEKKNISPHLFYPSTFSAITQMVPFDIKVVDIGCGIGILMNKLRQDRKNEVFGIDISKVAIETLNERNMEGIVAKVPPIPLPSSFCDIAIATELLEHVNDPSALLKEMARIIRPNGRLIITVPDKSFQPQYIREHLRTYDEKKLFNEIAKIKEITNIQIKSVWEEIEQVNRLVLLGDKLNKK